VVSCMASRARSFPAFVMLEEFCPRIPARRDEWTRMTKARRQHLLRGSGAVRPVSLLPARNVKCIEIVKCIESFCGFLIYLREGGAEMYSRILKCIERVKCMTASHQLHVGGFGVKRQVGA